MSGLTAGSRPETWGKPITVRWLPEPLRKLQALVDDAEKNGPSWPRATPSSILVQLVDEAFKVKGLKLAAGGKVERDDRQLRLLEESSPLSKSVAAVEKSVKKLGRRTRAGSRKTAPIGRVRRRGPTKRKTARVSAEKKNVRRPRKTARKGARK